MGWESELEISGHLTLALYNAVSNDLFSDDPLPAPSTRPKPQQKSKPAPSEDDLFSDPLAGSRSPKTTKPKPTKTESNDLFSDEPPAVAKVDEVPVKKKPAGAVSMFGGLDPFAAAAAAKGKAGGGKGVGGGRSHDQEKPRLSTSPPTSEAEKKDNLFGEILETAELLINMFYMHVHVHVLLYLCTCMCVDLTNSGGGSILG